MGRYRGKQAEKSMKKHRYRVLPRFKFGVLGLPVPTLQFGGSVSGTLATVSKPWLDSAFPIYRTCKRSQSVQSNPWTEERSQTGHGADATLSLTEHWPTEELQASMIAGYVVHILGGLSRSRRVQQNCITCTA